MSITSLNGKRFAEMIIQGANHLAANAQMVDALNVFLFRMEIQERI